MRGQWFAPVGPPRAKEIRAAPAGLLQLPLPQIDSSCSRTAQP